MGTQPAAVGRPDPLGDFIERLQAGAARRPGACARRLYRQAGTRDRRGALPPAPDSRQPDRALDDLGSLRADAATVLRGVGPNRADAALPFLPVADPLPLPTAPLRIHPAPSAGPGTCRHSSAKGSAPLHRGSLPPPRASIAGGESGAVPSRPSRATRLVSFSKPAPGSSASLTTIRSRSLRSSLASPLASASPVSRAKPTMTLPFFRSPFGGAEDVFGGLHRDRQRALDPGPLAVARAAGPVVGRGRGHDQHIGRGQLGPHRVPPARGWNRSAAA